MFRIRPIWLLLAVLIAPLPRAAHAADSYDSCTGFITSLPTTISTQGVWCLNGDLATTIASGNAITVAANNVTIDCNHFKLGGLGAGTSTQVTGIFSNRVATTIRHCNLRGFQTGVHSFGASLLMEDNRLESNTYAGVYTHGTAAVVRRNEIVDTGGSPYVVYAFGILTGDHNVQIIDNGIDGVFGDGAALPVAGILAVAVDQAVISGNRIGNLARLSTGQVVAIEIRSSTSATVAGNIGFGQTQANYGVLCTSSSPVLIRDNTMLQFDDAQYAGCVDGGGNQP